MRDLTRYAPEELRELQDRALTEMFGCCEAARDITYKMINLPHAEGDLYERLRLQWQMKITEAVKWGDLVPAVTAEIRRREQPVPIRRHPRRAQPGKAG